jgi:hypothetical protein
VLWKLAAKKNQAKLVFRFSYKVNFRYALVKSGHSQTQNTS